MKFPFSVLIIFVSPVILKTMGGKFSRSPRSSPLQMYMVTSHHQVYFPRVVVDVDPTGSQYSYPNFLIDIYLE